jgi:hypothetical protein
VEAQAMGYQIPLPFGIGVTAYSAKQPVNIKDSATGTQWKPAGIGQELPGDQ